MSTDNYYKDLWNNPNTEAGQFFNKVDFNHKDYKDQEQVFRNFLKCLKAVRALYKDQKPIETVLEAGAGTGRMTKIMLEELPSIEYYVAVDINEPSKFFLDNENKIRYIKDDIMDVDHSGNFDLVLASELFMHIKPEHIGPVITKLVKLLDHSSPSGTIINIDWVYQPQESKWCYIHDYDKMYRENGLFPVFMMDVNRQKLFCYGK